MTSRSRAQAYLEADWKGFGRIEGLRLKASVLSTPKPTANTEPAEIDWGMSVNANGIYLGLRGAICRMRTAQSSVSIVVTASTAGLRRSHGLSIYAAFKHALVAPHRSVVVEQVRDGIRINGVCRGEVHLPMLTRGMEAFTPTEEQQAKTRDAIAWRLPIGQVAGPVELAEPAAWLFSDQASHVRGATSSWIVV